MILREYKKPMTGDEAYAQYNYFDKLVKGVLHHMGDVDPIKDTARWHRYYDFYEAKKALKNAAYEDCKRFGIFMEREGTVCKQSIG